MQLGQLFYAQKSNNSKNVPNFQSFISTYLTYFSGSIASNTIFPGGSGQEPHIDYPYWDYYDKDHWPQPPKHKDIPFYMNLQILIPLDDLTPENGATSVRPYTQVVAEYPTNVEEYRSELVGQNFVTSGRGHKH